MRQKMSPWQLLFYVSWAVIALWLILKLAGVINTPVWLEYGVPLASVLLGIFGMYQNILEQLKSLTVGFATLNAKLEHVDKDVDTLKKHCFMPPVDK